MLASVKDVFTPKMKWRVKMAVSNGNIYKPDEALHELYTQETIVKIAVDVQTILQILVDKEIVDREEVNKYRHKVMNSPKYKPALEEIKRQKLAFQKAKDNPEAYLKELFKAKLEGRIN